MSMQTLFTICDLSNLAYKNFNVFNITFEKWTKVLHLMPEEIQTFIIDFCMFAYLGWIKCT